MRYLTVVVGLSLIILPPSARGIEPGVRLRAGPSVLKLLGSVGDKVDVGGADLTIGAGGFLDVSYRFQDTFSAGFRWTWHSLGVSGHDQSSYDSASFQDLLFVTTLFFNPDEDTRPFANVGLGMSWLGWRYREPYPPFPEEPDFVLNDDRRRATMFMFGGGAEVGFGDRWEFTPALQLALHGWSDHTFQGVPQVNPEEESQTVAPTTLSLELALGLARRF